MEKTNVTTNGGAGFFGILQIVFIALKLLGISKVAEWPWLFGFPCVFLPTYISLGILVVVVLVFLILLNYVRK